MNTQTRRKLSLRESRAFKFSDPHLDFSKTTTLPRRYHWVHPRRLHPSRMNWRRWGWAYAYSCPAIKSADKILFPIRRIDTFHILRVIVPIIKRAKNMNIWHRPANLAEILVQMSWAWTRSILRSRISRFKVIINFKMFRESGRPSPISSSTWSSSELIKKVSGLSLYGYPLRLKLLNAESLFQSRLGQIGKQYLLRSAGAERVDWHVKYEVWFDSCCCKDWQSFWHLPIILRVRSLKTYIHIGNRIGINFKILISKWFKMKDPVLISTRIRSLWYRPRFLVMN